MDAKNPSIHDYFKSGKPSPHLQAGLGKAVSVMFEAFSEHNRIWAFSEPGDDSPFLLDEVKRMFVDLPLCPTAVVGRGKDLEGWSGSHVKAGPSPDELCAVRGSFLPHCIFRAR